MEEDKKIREHARLTNMDVKILDHKIDELWSKLSLYNAYQMFVQLSSIKQKNPYLKYKAELEKGDEGYIATLDDHDKQLLKERYEILNEIWEGQTEKDLLSVYFTATSMLPVNGIRTLVNNTHNSLKAIGGADKMLSSIYGISITSMVRGFC